MEKIHYFYKTIHIPSGNYYYGIHSTYNIEDGYLGSGTHLKRAIKRYGKEQFCKEILKFFNSRKEASDYEKQVVNDSLLLDQKCYNLKTGGDLGEFGGSLSSTVREKISKALKGKPKSEEARKNSSFSKKGKKYPNRQGKVRITNEQEDRFVSKEDLQGYLEKGYRVGASKTSCKKSIEGLKQQGTHHTQKGRITINDGYHKKFVYPEDVQKYLDSGWKRGGLPISEEQKKLISARNLGRIAWNRGKEWSEEIRKKMRKPKTKKK